MKEKMIVNEKDIGIEAVLTPGKDCLNLSGKKCFLNFYNWLGDPALEFK